MKLLVTGAMGFVGLNLIRNMAENGHFSEILATDLAPPNSAEQAFIRHPSVSHASLDTADRPAVSAVFDRFRPTHVIHAAAITPGSDLAAEDTTHVFDINLTATIGLFDAAARFDVERTILLSSSGVYAHTGGPVRDEEDPLALDQPYGASKHAAEIVARAYLRHTDIVVARLGPIYGPMERQRPTRPRVSLIGRLATAQSQRRGISIAGHDVTRDWTFTADATDAIERLLATKTLRHRVYNVSSGERHAVSTVVSIFQSHGLDVRWGEGGEAEILVAADDERTPLSIGRLTADTGFSPEWTLQDGIAATIAAGKDTSFFN